MFPVEQWLQLQNQWMQMRPRSNPFIPLHTIGTIRDTSDRRLPAAASASPAESLLDRVGRAKARWLRRVMYETTATSTEKCLAYSITDHLNCVTLDSWPSQARLTKLLGFQSTKTVQRAARGLERLGVLKLGRIGHGHYRYAPVFAHGDQDKNVTNAGRPCPPRPDKDVRESLLPIQLTTSTPTPTEVARQGSESMRSIPAYNPRQRGEFEIKVAEMLGRDGMEILGRFAAFDDAIVDRLCRAYVSGLLGERELAAARLAAEQM